MIRFFKRIVAKRWLMAFLLLAILIIAGITINLVRGTLINMKKTAQPDNRPQWYPKYPKISTNSNPNKREQIKRGEILVKAGDCMACHTDTHKKGPVFAGGLPMQTPFGVIYTPNITPDTKTGIGKWTDKQFIHAMREGIAPNGQYYYPAFPYLYFNKMPAEDLKAIKAYLDEIPAVDKTNTENEMVFPFNLRILQLPWRILFFHPDKKDVFKPFNTTANNPVKRGEYIVEGPGHCSMCHTPSWYLLTDKLPLGAPRMKHNLVGAPVQGFLAPNISSANLGKVPNQEIIDVFKKDKLVGGGEVLGPMLEVNHNSLSHLSNSDLNAIASYLKTVKSTPLAKTSSASGGKGIYENNCAACHAAGAGGAPRFGDAAAWAPFIEPGLKTMYKHAIHGIKGMPAKGACLDCTDNEIEQAVDYMVTAVQGKSVKASTPVKELTIKDGEEIYAKNCSVCHNDGFKGAPKPGDVNAFKSSAKAGFLQTYLNVVDGKNGHPVRGACPTCTDAELKAAIQYMMQKSIPESNYSLW